MRIYSFSNKRLLFHGMISEKILIKKSIKSHGKRDNQKLNNS